MTSKERVLAAVNMQPTDRQPCDFHACGVVVERLRAHLGVTSYKEILRALGSDIVDIRGVVDPKWIAPFPKECYLEDGTKQDYLGFRKKVQETVFGPVEEHSDYVLSRCETLEELQQFRFPKVEWFDFSEMSGQLKPYAGFAIMASGASVYQHPTLVRGLDQLLCDLMTEPELAVCVIDAYTNFYLAYFDAMFTACKGQIDILRIADDFGMQDRPLVSKELFREFFAPRIKKLCDMAHAHNVKVMFHSCGAVFEFIGMLMEAGVDILDPLQPNAAGMSPEHLGEHYQGKICLHGSIDTQFVLPTGTPEQVREQVREHMRILGSKKTGFIIAPAHSLQPDVKTENIIALYDEVKIFAR